MTKDDLLETFLMRNDTEVCKYAQTPEPISWAEHEAVFLYTDYPKLVFCVKSYALFPFEEIAGYVEFRNDIINDNPNTKIWGFHLDSEWRGKGLAKVMLEKALTEAKKYGISKILGIVKKNNEISNHLHKALGFAIIEDNDETYIYELNIS